jgi:hypothetical protein
MSLQDTIRTRMAAVISTHSFLSVAVVYDGQNASAMRVLTDKQTTDSEYGHGGSVVYTIRVASDDIGEPVRGAKMIVDGNQVYVLNCRTSGGLRVIQCSDTQPVEGL